MSILKAACRMTALSVLVGALFVPAACTGQLGRLFEMTDRLIG